jgi:hypothetical protein
VAAIRGDLDNALDVLVGAGAVGQESPKVLGSGELDRVVTSQELAHGDQALLIDLARQSHDAANLVRFQRGEGDAR